MEDVRVLKYNIKWDVWDGKPITDIHFKNYDLVTEFMWHTAFHRNLIYEGLGFFEMDEIEPIYRNYVRHILRNECSVMMLNEEETEILAVGLLEWMTHEWHSWVFLPYVAPSGMFQDIIFMKQQLMETAKQNLGIFDSLMVQEIHVPEDLILEKSFMMCLFEVFSSVAQHMKMPRVCFVAMSCLDQEAANLAEYVEIDRTIYSIYKVNDKRPFDILRELDEMYAILYELPVPTIVKYEDMKGFEVFQEAHKAKLRKERGEDIEEVVEKKEAKSEKEETEDKEEA